MKSICGKEDKMIPAKLKSPVLYLPTTQSPVMFLCARRYARSRLTYFYFKIMGIRQNRHTHLLDYSLSVEIAGNQAFWSDTGHLKKANNFDILGLKHPPYILLEIKNDFSLDCLSDKNRPSYRAVAIVDLNWLDIGHDTVSLSANY